MKKSLIVLLVVALGFSGVSHARSVGVGTCDAGGKLILTAQAPLLSSGALTQLNMAALFANMSQPTANLVTVTVANTSSQPMAFRLLFQLKAIPADPRLRESCPDPLPDEGGQGCWIQRGILQEYTIQPGEVWLRTSTQLESESYQSRAIDPETSPFQQLLVREGVTPPGAIYLNIGLLCPRDGNNENLHSTPTAALPIYAGVVEPLRSFKASYQPPQPATLLFPGSPASEGFQPIATLTPTFVFAGNLDGVDLGGESAYRFSLWSVRENEAIGEALDRRPLQTQKLSHSPLIWNSGWAPLEPGKRYAWRVDALLRGLTVDWLPSSAYGFQTPNDQGTLADGGAAGVAKGVSAPPGSDPPHPTAEQLEIIEALSQVIGPYRPALEQLLRRSLPDPTAMKIGASPATLTEFRSLIRDILEGRATVVGAEAKP